MTGNCKIAECPAPELKCHLGADDYATCANFTASSAERNVKKENGVIKKSNIGWSGHALATDELSIVTGRSSPVLIGIMGKADAGKTTYLAMLFTLLLNGGKFQGYEFAGSKTVLSWDELHHRLKLKKGNVPFPQPTPVSYNRVYHLALRDNNKTLKDVLFADASGEVFSLWSVNRNDENAENARWIYSHSNGFMLFIDCEALISEKNAAKKEILLLARQLTHDLKGRPVIAVWSKADKKNQILSAIHESLKKELEGLFPNYKDIDISNFLEPGPDELVHKNNLAALDWLLQQILLPSNVQMEANRQNSDDSFINYQGK
jgi:hypothetical protein